MAETPPSTGDGPHGPAAGGSRGDPPPASVLRLDTAGIGAVATVAAVLSAVGGYVDAVVYLRVARVFIANQSGNLILEGIALGERRWADAVLPIASIAGFVVGAAIVVALADRRPDDPESGRRRVRGVLAAETLLLLALAGVLWVAGLGRSVGPVGPVVGLVVGWAAGAMGAQAVAVRRARGLPVLTTAGSGALTDLGVALGRSADAAERRLVPAVVRTIGTVVVFYVAGATAGALLASATSLGPELLVVPAVVVFCLLVVERLADPSS